METALTNLGFAKAPVPNGAHICQVYSDDNEREDALLKFCETGLRLNETTGCFYSGLDIEALREHCRLAGVDIDEERERGHFVLTEGESLYFQDGVFDPERMLGLVTAFHEQSVATSRAGARVIGEMTSRITSIPGGTRLFEYEAKVNALLTVHPVTAVCQYDARKFDGATIMDVLSVHPFMVVHGNVIQNPFFVSPASLSDKR